MTASEYDRAARVLQEYGITLLPAATPRRRRRRQTVRPIGRELPRTYLPSRREINAGTAAIRRGWSRRKEAARRTRVPVDVWTPTTQGGEMLVLSRKVSQRIQIGEDVTITVVDIGRNRVRLGIEAPKAVPIVRDDAHGQTIPAPAVDPVSP